MKEKRKKEREEAKKRKEEEQKKKADERAKKREEKAKAKAEKEAEKGKGKQSRSVGTKRSQVARSTRPAKSHRLAPNPTSQINASECCVCFVTYDNDQSGKDWVACACGQWLHEDCTDNCITDSDGNERLSFICLDHFSI